MHKNKGQALIFTYAVIVFLTILSIPLLDKIMSERWTAERQRLERETFYLAEGGLEDAINQFTDAIANFQVAPNVARYPATGSINTVYTVSTAFPSGASASSVITEAEPSMRTIVDPDGSAIGVKVYTVTSTCQHPMNSTISATLNQAIILRVIYTFQHAVFYNDDLEMLPGPNMNLTGRIHSNSDIYLGTHNTFTVDSEYLHSAGDIYNRRKDSTQDMEGDVRIRRAGTGAYFNMEQGGVILDSDSPDWLTESQTRWNGTVKSSVHGVTELSTPVVGSIQPGGYYASNAEVTIENGTITENGSPLIEGVDIPAGTIITDNDFYNNREGMNILMTNIDLSKLAGYANPADASPTFPNHLPSNGLIYATRNDAGMTEQPGVRLVNGSQIYRNDGLTIVSNDPVYIQGNYNSVNKKPTAVICDSVNLLSTAWNDADSLLNLNHANRDAANTTVNTAFIAGVDNTTTGNYNGGLENYPRFHEDWSGRTLTIRGAFVELWNTQIAQGAWVYGSPQYTAPNRNWDYDSDFNDVNNMPPFTPWAVEAQRTGWWK
ncbi:MAG: hypothetical protein AB1481_03740 [Candidatus Omnitrophota bacterium]